ncbi:MAG: tetratricopeptide repeat protein [Bacteroidales bacterium]|nr:tetratricopeptide repeat protein [Bacteroidales bacterium]
MKRVISLHTILLSILLLVRPNGPISAEARHGTRIDSTLTHTIDSLLLAADNIDEGPKQMLIRSKQAYELSIQHNYYYGKLHSTYNIARAMFYQSRLQTSYQLLDSLLIGIEADSAAVSQIIDYQVTRSKIYSLMGVIFHNLNDYTSSLHYYFKALSLIEETGPDYDIGLIYKGLGGLNLTAGNREKANEYFQKAIEIGERSNDQKIKFDVLNERYEFEKNAEEYQQALETSIKLYGLAQSTETVYMTAIALKNLGEIYFLLKEYKLAQAYLRGVTSSAAFRQFPNVLSETNTLLSKMAYENSRFDSSEYFARQAWEHAQQTSILSLKAEALLELAASQKANGKHYQAINSLSDHLLYKDSLISINNSHQILLMQSKFDLDKVLSEKKLIENELTIKMLESSRKTYLLWGSILLIILMAWLSLVMIRRYRFEKRIHTTLDQQQQLIHDQKRIIQKDKEIQLQMELEHKNRELITRAMTLSKMQEDKLRLMKELQEIFNKLRQTNNENASLIEVLIRQLRATVQTDQWEDFKIYFENVYSEFYTRLLATHPDLTPNERKLCALLKLNLTTKEIAAINARGIRSIESARNRLRKKLGLSAETNLTLYLSEF